MGRDKSLRQQNHDMAHIFILNKSHSGQFRFLLKIKDKKRARDAAHCEGTGSIHTTPHLPECTDNKLPTSLGRVVSMGVLPVEAGGQGATMECDLPEKVVMSTALSPGG